MPKPLLGALVGVGVALRANSALLGISVGVIVGAALSALAAAGSRNTTGRSCCPECSWVRLQDL